jgi:hypothetical protein
VFQSLPTVGGILLYTRLKQSLATILNCSSCSKCSCFQLRFSFLRDSIVCLCRNYVLLRYRVGAMCPRSFSPPVNWLKEGGPVALANYNNLWYSVCHANDFRLHTFRRIRLHLVLREGGREGEQFARVFICMLSSATRSVLWKELKIWASQHSRLAVIVSTSPNSIPTSDKKHR